MLNVNQLPLKENLLIIDEYEVQVQPTMGTSAVIQKTQDQIDQDKRTIRFRLGKVIKSGDIDEKTLTQFSTKGKTLKNVDVLYTADAVDKIDIPLCQTIDGKDVPLKNPVFLNVDYIFSIVEPEVIPVAEQ